MRTKFIVGVFLLAIIGSTAGCWIRGKGKTFDNWESRNTKFGVRITAYEEGGWVGGARYLFEAAPAGSNDWREIMLFRHDDPVPISHNQVHFVNDQVGYCFMGWMYAVTTDSGAHWAVWNAERDLPNWKCCNYVLIREVDIAPDGAGVMKLNAVPQRQGEVPELHTQDYGRHWTSE